MLELIAVVSLALGAIPEPGVIEEIQVTASRRAESTRESVQAITVVSREDLINEAPQITADAFRGQAGVFVQQTTPGQGIPIVRGLKGSEVLHLVDGMRMNNAFFRNAPNQYVALLDPGQVDRVEVVRGPASTLYGADAMGGVVQFVTRKPDFREQAGQTWQMDLTAATSDRSVMARGSLEGGAGNQAYRVQVSYQDVGDRHTGEGRISPSGYEARSFNGSYRLALSDNNELQFNWQHLRQPRTPRTDELVAGFGQYHPASSEFYFEPNQRDFAQLRWMGSTEQRFFQRYELNLAWQQVQDDRRIRDFQSPTRNLEENSSALWSLNGQFQGDNGGNLDWVFGFEVNQDEVTSRRSRVTLDSGAVESVRSRFPDGSTQDSMAAFAHTRYQLSPGFRVEGGLRYSAFEIDLTPTELSPGASLDPKELTFSAGLNWELTEGLNLVANVGEGFRAPNIFDLGTLGPRPGNRFNVANPGLEPERLLGYDIGLKLSKGPWTAQWVIFYTDYEDKISSVSTGEFTADDRIVVRSENLNKVVLRGSEMSAEWAPGDAWTWFATANFVHGELTDNGVDAPADRVPPVNGRLGAAYDWSSSLRIRAFTEFARHQNRLSGRDIRDPRIDPDGTDGWATINLQLDWHPGDDWRVGLGLKNLFDRTYREHGSGLDARGRDLVLSVSRTF